MGTEYKASFTPLDIWSHRVPPRNPREERRTRPGASSYRRRIKRWKRIHAFFPPLFQNFPIRSPATSRRTLATIQRRRSRCTPRFSLIILDESDPLPPPRQIISAVRSDRNLKTEDEGEKTKKHGGERFSRVSDSVQ